MLVEIVNLGDPTDPTAAVTVVASSDLQILSSCTPPAPEPDPTISFSQATLCPGESVTLTINGISDGSRVALTAPRFFRTNSGGVPAQSLLSGPGTYEWWSYYVGTTVTIDIISTTNPSDPSIIPTVLATTSMDVLSDCASPPAPDEPATATSSALPETGLNLSIVGIAIGSGLAFAILGFFIIRTGRQLHVVSVNQRLSARMKHLDAILRRIENSPRRGRSNRR